MDKNFSNIEDIIADEQFQAWYFRTDGTNRNEWERWMAENPQQAALVAEAKEYLDQLVITEQPLPEAQLVKAEERLMAGIASMEAPVILATPSGGVVRKMKRWIAAAAVVLVMVAGGLYWLNRTAQDMVQTSFGELKEQQLPDGSKVTLNANSTITYSKGWDKGHEREVWLKGEAFFHVAKTPARSRFVVHTDRFDVVVTGTQFNVVNRDEKTNIMLTEGSVTLHTPDGKTYKMVPGDFVEVSHSELQKKTGREENILAWKDKKLIFENIPLHSALDKIEEHYGIKITIGNANIGNKPITAILPNDNLDVLLDALEATGDFHVIRKDGEIIITE
ncbi:MAG: FecR domain-containing protein [Chitinophagaceae bacterium]|nr:FecR domain-containing protein [Chitinophagaceae bacterium]